MPPATDYASRQAQACHLVQEIARSHGYLGEEVLSRMDADTRRQVEEALLRKDEMIGTSVITLAKNLYSKDVRFIFELLQNADDNHFTRAVSLGAAPYVSFHVYKDRIVIDCNEDGFNEENIRAICNVGKSSKTGAQGYIGEKGIGFKSVFKVAWKVEIQSGAYSFSFSHRKGNSGFGMISPEWFWPAQELATPLTRMTLYLHENDDAGGGPAQRQNILDQLKELQPAMLLFLKKLKRIDVKIDSGDGKNETISSTSLSVHHSEASRRVLEKVQIENGKTESTKQKYHIAESTARNLPRNENREYSATEEILMAYSTAPVVLAFPLSEDDAPVLKPQELFAFLPVRQVGFNFLIHSDFVTLANREDIVTTSSRNIQLLDALANSFIVGMRELCQHPTLKYQWMRYLPKLTDYPWDPFWKRLVDKIKERILDEEILILRDSSILARISRARRLSRLKSDQHNRPLFDDLPGNEASYISPNYQVDDLALLNDYGLQYLYQEELLRRVKRDLSHKSRLRTSTDNDWQTRAARCLDISFEKGWTDRIRDTKELELVPLTCGKWVNTINGGVYFGDTSSGYPIPSDLGYQLVDPAATRLLARKQLFTNLGIKHLSDVEVRTAILRKYEHTKPNDISLETSLSHLRFLYLTHRLNPPVLRYPNMFLYDADGKLQPLKDHAFYFKDTAPYGLWSLLSKVDKSPGWPNIHFLHEKYQEAIGSASQEDWKRWLKLLGVREYPRLVKGLLEPATSESSLSEECRFVAEYLPSGLLGFLRYGWNGGGKVTFDGHLDDLKALTVPCQGGRMIALSETYLPLPALLAKRDEFMRYNESFPFLDLGDASSQISQWDFLKELGVGFASGLDFFFKILENMSDNPTDPSRIAHLYLRIQFESLNLDPVVRKENDARVCNLIQSKSRLFVPSHEDKAPFWSAPSFCLLEGPIGMKTKHPVMPRYQNAFAKSEIDFSALKQFFHSTLGVPKCSWQHIVDELTYLRISGCDFSAALPMYEHLRKTKIPRGSTEDLRNAFENSNGGLLLVNGKWYKSSQCLWSETSTPIRGKVNLSDTYNPEFETFFVDVLGVSRLDASLIYGELLELKPADANIQHVKDLIWNLNSLLEIGAPKFSKLPLLPLRSGDSKYLRLFDSEFAILDRKALDPVFSDKVTLLDFTVQEVCQLKPFIKWAGLEDCYLSRLVKETSTLHSSDKLPISDASQDVRRKAYGLYRIATEFQSPRIQHSGQDFYDLLCMCRTWETPRIQTTLSVTVGLSTVTENVDRGDIHIDDADGQLQIYVPRDEALRDKSYVSLLPKRLVHWMMTDPTTGERKPVDPVAIMLVETVLLTKVAVVNHYLDNQGIIEVEVPDLEQSVHTGSFSSALQHIPEILGPVTPERASTPLSGTSSSEDEYFEQETPATDLTSLGSPGPRLARNRSPSSQEYLSPDPFITPTAERQKIAAEEYRALLSQVASAARKSRLLSKPFDLSDLSDALGDDTTPIMKTFNEYDLFGAGMAQFERDRRVGAAGELFVFELLSALNPALNGFTRGNWMSTIRKYARAHPDYADMDDWNGNETSDLEYEDVDGTLTESLVRKGHLHGSWRARRPKFYIEVKATPGPWNNAFFMSHAQHEKMKKFTTNDSVYVIFRVFNLYTSGIGCKIFVDPVKLEQEGQLVFTADRWTVKPQ